MNTLNFGFSIKLATGQPLVEDLVQLLSPCSRGIFQAVDWLQHCQCFFDRIDILEIGQLPQTLYVCLGYIKFDLSNVSSRQGTQLFKCHPLSKCLRYVKTEQDELRVFRCYRVNPSLPITANCTCLSIQVLELVLKTSNNQPTLHSYVALDHLPNYYPPGVYDIVTLVFGSFLEAT